MARTLPTGSSRKLSSKVGFLVDGAHLVTDEQRTYSIGKRNEAEKLAHGGDRKSRTKTDLDPQGVNAFGKVFGTLDSFFADTDFGGNLICSSGLW